MAQYIVIDLNQYEAEVVKPHLKPICDIFSHPKPGCPTRWHVCSMPSNRLSVLDNDEVITELLNRVHDVRVYNILEKHLRKRS